MTGRVFSGVTGKKRRCSAAHTGASGQLHLGGHAFGLGQDFAGHDHMPALLNERGGGIQTDTGRGARDDHAGVEGSVHGIEGARLMFIESVWEEKIVEYRIRTNEYVDL